MGEEQYISGIEEQLKNIDISKEDRDKVIESFLAVDTNRSGYLDRDELEDAFAAVGKAPAKYKVRDCIKKFDKDDDNRLSPSEYAQVYGELCSDSAAKEFRGAVKAKINIVTTAGSTGSAEGTHHSYNPEEMVAFCNWINQNLKNDPDLKDHLPIDFNDPEKFFQGLSDGIILCKMINLSQKDTIDERAINKKKSANKAVQIHKDQENLNLALNSASAIGCSIVNIGASDIKDKKAHLILGLLWQVIRIGLFAAFDLTRSPDLAVLLKDGEELADLMALSPEALLLRWMNYHLQKSEKYKAERGDKEITNFSGDIKDSCAYLCLLEQIQPREDDDGYTDNMFAVNLGAHPGTDHASLEARAGYMLEQAEKIKCSAFVTKKDVANGNSKLNLAFVANLFNTFPCLHDQTEREIIAETREEKTYRNWMNSLGASPRVNRLYNDLRDGIVFLQLFECVQPGIVKNKINRPPFAQIGGNMKKLENCNQVITLGHQMKYSLVGIGGSNLREGTKGPVLSVTWQLMRGYTLSILEKLNQKGSGAEKAIVEWVNTKLQSSGKSTSIESFKDKSIATSHVVIDLVDAVGGPNTIDYSNVKPGNDDEEKRSNAKYAISMARKMGARVYALPDDLWEVVPKMVMTIFACIMARAMQLQIEEEQTCGANE